jgi:acetoin utilization deacetylase AcuC-like enzyme
MTRCRAVFGPVFFEHDLSTHDESGERLREAVRGVPPDVPVLDPAPASPEDLLTVHTPAHVRMIRELCSHGGLHYIDNNTYITSRSFDVASCAAGAAIEAVNRAIDGEHCFALVRPPGHHAEPDRAMGYCLFNNAAIAAYSALKRVRRVAILDWDLHHGNGTQKVFYGSDRVLFCSIHQGNSFPRTGWVDEIGTGPGRGFTLNAPIRSGAGIADYRAVFERIFIPAMQTFAPDLVIVSAGQDPLSDDPHGGMRLVPEDFGTLTRIVMDCTGTPLAFVLEGGYGPSHGNAIREIFAALKGDAPPEKTENADPRQSTLQIIAALQKLVA